MTLLEHPRHVSVTEATRRGVAGMITDAAAGDIIVTRRDRPVAAVVSVERLERIQEMVDDLRDLTLAASRVVTDDGARVSFDELLTAYGLSRDDLDDVEDGPADTDG